MRLKKKMYYQLGFQYETIVDITKKDIVKLCKILNKILNSLDYYKGYKGLCTFEPEPIYEGGIVYKFKNVKEGFSKCPTCKNKSCDRKWYKSIRFCLYTCHINPRSRVKWPWINDNVMDEWENSDDIVIPNKSVFDTFLKALHGSPAFTEEELDKIDDAFCMIGMKRTFKRK